MAACLKIEFQSFLWKKQSLLFVVRTNMDIYIAIAGKFPTLVTHQESLESKVNETKAMVKFQLKKVLCMGVAVGNVAMEEKQVFQNVQMSVNFLVSLLKKNWQNVSQLLHLHTRGSSYCMTTIIFVCRMPCPFI